MDVSSVSPRKPCTWSGERARQRAARGIDRSLAAKLCAGKGADAVNRVAFTVSHRCGRSFDFVGFERDLRFGPYNRFRIEGASGRGYDFPWTPFLRPWMQPRTICSRKTSTLKSTA